QTLASGIAPEGRAKEKQGPRSRQKFGPGCRAFAPSGARQPRPNFGERRYLLALRRARVARRSGTQPDAAMHSLPLPLLVRLVIGAARLVCFFRFGVEQLDFTQHIDDRAQVARP